MPRFRTTIDLVLILLLALYILAGATLTSFHGDESTQIFMSRDFAYQFLDGDLARVQFSDPPVSAQEQELRLLNGSVNKYLIGLAWHIAGFDVSQINEQWDWAADWNYNQNNGHAPTPELLQAARWPSALLLASGVLWMYLIGRQIGGRPTAWLAALLFALHPALLINGRRAMMEGSLIAFSLLTLLLVLVWLRASDRHAWISAVALGLASGLALASKHTAVFGLVPIFAGVLVWVLAVSRQRGQRWVLMRLLHIALAALLLAMTFLALNPVWWGDPVARAGDVLRLRESLLAGQTAAFGGYADASEAAVGFLRQTLGGPAQAFEVTGWEVWLAGQIEAYDRSIWRGIALAGVVGIAVMLAAVVIGFVRCVRDSTVPWGVRWITAVWAGGIFMLTAALTPIEWTRYYLLAIVAAQLMAAYGVSGLVVRAWRRLRGHPG